MNHVSKFSNQFCRGFVHIFPLFFPVGTKILLTGKNPLQHTTPSTAETRGLAMRTTYHRERTIQMIKMTTAMSTPTPSTAPIITPVLSSSDGALAG